MSFFISNSDVNTPVGDELIATITKNVFADTADEYANLAIKSAKVFRYRFDYAPKYYKEIHLGAYHTAEIPYVFSTLNKVQDPSVYNGCEEKVHALSKEMHQAWINFAHTGDPGWEDYNSNGYIKIFD